MSYKSYISITASGVSLGAGDLKNTVKFAKTWIRESPYFDPNDSVLIKELSWDENGVCILEKVIKILTKDDV